MGASSSILSNCKIHFIVPDNHSSNVYNQVISRLNHKNVSTFDTKSHFNEIENIDLAIFIVDKSITKSYKQNKELDSCIRLNKPIVFLTAEPELEKEKWFQLYNNVLISIKTFLLP